MAVVYSGRSFGVAFCAHFNLNASDILEEVSLNANGDEVLSVSLKYIVSARDLEEIALLMQMKERNKHEY